MVAKTKISWMHDLRIYIQALRLQIRSNMSLRGAFAIQLVGVALYNSAQIVAWLFLFHQFGTINGWAGRELIGLMGINMLVFGVVMFLSIGITDLPRHVDYGSFDNLLVKPSPLILQLASGKLDATNAGDAMLGLGITVWYMATTPLSFLQVLLFLLALVVSAVIFWCFALLLPSILAFYVFDSERISARLGMLILDSSSYPTGVLTDVLRAALLTILPGLLIGAVPLQLLNRFEWQAVLFGVVVAIFWLAFSLWFFHRSLRRYESSNLIGTR